MKQEQPDTLEKRIKKHLYGKPQTILATFPPGLGAAAMAEVQAILASLWFPPKSPSLVSLLKNAIRIEAIHLFAATELLQRSQCLTDVRLIIEEGKASGKAAFEKKCRAIAWEFYLQKEMSVKLRLDSVASHAFHEGALKSILQTILADHQIQVVRGEDSEATTTIYADYYRDYLMLSISLAGQPLYKRGYRGILSSSAPLREDAAASCLQRALQFALAKNPQYKPESVLIPFSGTGTFMFEWALAEQHVAPVLCGRDYALQQMPLFRQEHFHYLLKKAREHCQVSSASYFCIDQAATANASLTDNLVRFNAMLVAAGLSELNTRVETGNFLEMEVSRLALPGDVFIPLNPPYGIRLGQSAGTTALYKQISQKMNAIASQVARGRKSVAGLILCPSEAAWTAFCRGVVGAEMETYHFTQGGLDIRVCNVFWNGNEDSVSAIKD